MLKHVLKIPYHPFSENMNLREADVAKITMKKLNLINSTLVSPINDGLNHSVWTRKRI